MFEHLPRRAMLIALALAAIAASGAAAAVRFLPGTGPANPDPGNRRLHILAADPVFAALPPGAVHISWQQNPAKHRGNLFEAPGWDGPSVVLTFTSSRPVRDVYRFYDERAREAGWTPWQKVSMGFPWSWSKDIAGKRSFAALRGNFNIHRIDLTEAGTPRGYYLTGST